MDRQCRPDSGCRCESVVVRWQTISLPRHDAVMQLSVAAVRPYNKRGSQMTIANTKPNHERGRHKTPQHTTTVTPLLRHNVLCTPPDSCPDPLHKVSCSGETQLAVQHPDAYALCRWSPPQVDHRLSLGRKTRTTTRQKPRSRSALCGSLGGPFGVLRLRLRLLHKFAACHRETGHTRVACTSFNIRSSTACWCLVVGDCRTCGVPDTR